MAFPDLNSPGELRTVGPKSDVTGHSDAGTQRLSPVVLLLSRTLAEALYATQVVPISMPQCAMCGESGLLFVHVFIARKKRKSYPVCIRHAAWAYALQEIGQDWGRTNLARAFGIKKGTIPRIKVDLTP